MFLSRLIPRSLRSFAAGAILAMGALAGSAQAAGPYAFVAEKGDDTEGRLIGPAVSVVDLGTDSVVERLGLDESPLDVVVDPRTYRVFVPSGPYLVHFDGLDAAATRVDHLLCCDEASGVALDSSRSRVYVSHRENFQSVGRVSVVDFDPSDPNLTSSYFMDVPDTRDLKFIAYDPASDRVWVIDKNGTVARSNGGASFVTVDTGIAPNPGGMIVHPQGGVLITQTILVPNAAAGRMGMLPVMRAVGRMVRIHDDTTVEISELPDTLPLGMAFANGGAYVAYESTPDVQIWPWNHVALSAGSSPHDVAVAPGGELVVANRWGSFSSPSVYGTLTVGRDGYYNGASSNERSISVGIAPVAVAVGPVPQPLALLSSTSRQSFCTDTGARSRYSLTFRHTGHGGAIQVGSLRITGTHSSSFSTTNDGCSQQLLASGESCSVQVSFQPSGEGSWTYSPWTGWTYTTPTRYYAALEAPNDASMSESRVSLQGGPCASPSRPSLGSVVFGR